MPTRKVGAGAVGAALATIIWTIVAAVTNAFSTSQIALLTGATATVLSFLLGYIVPDSGSGGGPQPPGPTNAA